MSHNIYNAEVHIDLEKIEELIQKNSDKGIICFGGGTAASILMKRILYKYNVECFLDNDKKLQGTLLMGKKICAPEILKNKEKNTFIVLILSKHYEVIGRQLSGYGLIEGQDYFNIYNEFRDYFYIMKFDTMGQRFLSFIERTPRDIMKSVESKDDKEIGIICNGTMEKNVLWYALGQYLILRYRGYDPTLIIDNMVNHDDYIYFKDYRKIVTKYLDYTLNFMQQYFGAVKVLYMNPEDKVSLDSQDEEFIKKMNKCTLRWLNSRYDEHFLNGKKDREEISLQIMRTNLMSAKHFFAKHSFKTITIYTGIHKHRGIYLWIGQLYGIRVSTYDGSSGDLMLFETNGVGSHSYDIKRMFQENWFTEKEKERILQFAQRSFEKRMYKTADDGDYNYQLVGEDQDCEKTYDIIMPLNIFWDSAALGVDRVFKDCIEWLNKTLMFLMDNTDASVMVRQHPAQNALPSYKYDDLTKLIPLLEERKERIFFCRAEDKINTYQYLKKCKLVLPYTSTVGLEAVILGVPIVTHTTVYYGGFSFGNQALTEEEYFHKIKRGLAGEFAVTEEQKKDALMAFYYQLNHYSKMDFTDACDKWLDSSLEEVNEEAGVDETVDIIVNNIPIIYNNIKKKLDSPRLEK